MEGGGGGGDGGGDGGGGGGDLVAWSVVSPDEGSVERRSLI